MAYGTRFNISFNDIKGVPYEIYIKQKDYTGAAESIDAGASGFVLTYSGTNRGVVNYIMGSKVEIELNITDSDEKLLIRDLGLSTDRDFIVDIYRDSGSGLYQFWTGFILTDLISWDDSAYPFSFNITASDGFGLAKDINYTNSVWDAAGVPSNVYRTHNQLIIEALNSIGIVNELVDSQPIMIGESFCTEDDQIDLPFLSKLESTRVDALTFVAYDTSTEELSYNFKSNLEVLEEVCKFHSARVLQWDGKFWFVPVTQYLNQTAKFFPLGLNGVFGSSENMDLFLETNEFERLVGGQFDFYPPLNEACVSYKYNYDSLDEVEETTNACGSSPVPVTKDSQDVFTFDGFAGYGGDADIEVKFGYSYNMVWAGALPNYSAYDNHNPPNNYKIIQRYRVTSGDKTYWNAIGTDFTPSTGLQFTTPQWSKQGEFTYTQFSNNQAALDISNMECFGMPPDERFVYLVLDGEIVSKDLYVYNASAKTITLSDVAGSVGIGTSSVLTVLFDYRRDYGYYHVDVSDSFSINGVADLSTAGDEADWLGAISPLNSQGNTAQDIVLYLNGIPEDSVDVVSNSISVYDPEDPDLGEYNKDLFLLPRSDERSDYGDQANLTYLPHPNAIRGGINTRKFDINKVSASGDYSAQPTNTSETIRICQSNDNDSSTKVDIPMMTGDKSEYNSDSNIQVMQTNTEWVNSDNWTMDFQTETFTGGIADVIAKTHTFLQEAPSVRYNGAIINTSNNYFSPIEGAKIVTFNDTADNLFFGAGSFNANMSEWRVQLVQFGLKS